MKRNDDERDAENILRGTKREGIRGRCKGGRPKGGIGTTDRVDVPKIPQTKTISYILFIIFSIEYDGTQI